MGYPAFQAGPSVLESGGWDAVKRPVRVANMEAISALKEEKPASRAAILNLPGESALWIESAGDTFSALFPPLTDSPLGPFVVKEDFLTDCWRSPISSTYPGSRGGHSEGTDCPYSKYEVLVTFRMRV